MNMQYALSRVDARCENAPLRWRLQAERARKNAENELNDASTRINELTLHVTTLTADKRRIESDFQSMHADMNEALNARRAADERADRLQMELNRLTEELRQVSTSSSLSSSSSSGGSKILK